MKELLYLWNWIISPSAVGAVIGMGLITLVIWLFPSIVLGRKKKRK